MPNNLSGNKGEWSEIYTFLKLLGDGKLYAADAELNKKDDVFYDVIKIIRDEKIGKLHFIFDGVNKKVDIKKESGEMIAVTETNKFVEEAKDLFDEILSKNNSSSFQVVKTSRFMDDIFCQNLKAPAADKSDITITVHDFNTGLAPTLGFSIKSRLGKPSTLLNAGKTTNFIYEIVGGMTDQDMENINNIFNTSDLKDERDISMVKRIDYIIQRGFNLEYDKMASATFQNNLMMLDSDLPEITANLLLEYYLNGTSNISTAIDEVSILNPLDYDFSQGHTYYTYKFKKLITESALGMLPGKVWTGRADASGGYIIVREDGEVLCYHLYNRNDFEDYLLNNVRFERASAKRHEFGIVEKENDKYYIKLNLQIRFLK